MGEKIRKNIVITQSNYIPWKGYFDAIAIADEFVIYDDMQYTKRDWRNRNVIKTRNGLKWLSVPVEVKGKYFQKISETKVSDMSWPKDHWNAIADAYSKAPAFREYKEFFMDLYLNTQDEFLTDINLRFLNAICGLLDITPKFRLSSEFELKEERTERLVHICESLQGTDYYSGPAARAYMDESKFHTSQINVHYFDYSGYHEYTQAHPPFEHGVSIIDLVMNEGSNAKNFLKHAKSS